MLTFILPYGIMSVWNTIQQKGGADMTDTKALRERISALGLKYKIIAQKLGISAYTLQRKIDNDVEFKVSEVDALASLLGLSLREKDEIFFAGQLN